MSGHRRLPATARNSGTIAGTADQRIGRTRRRLPLRRPRRTRDSGRADTPCPAVRPFLRWRSDHGGDSGPASVGWRTWSTSMPSSLMPGDTLVGLMTAAAADSDPADRADHAVRFRGDGPAELVPQHARRLLFGDSIDGRGRRSDHAASREYHQRNPGVERRGRAPRSGHLRALHPGPDARSDCTGLPRTGSRHRRTPRRSLPQTGAARIRPPNYSPA